MMIGTAGAYGGLSDSKKTRTVTGEEIDDTSMGVAIPISWPNHSSYIGKTISINYNGESVLARINDVGVLSDRDLDLQPGVFRAFGCDSCAEWGIRSISYLIL